MVYNMEYNEDDYDSGNGKIGKISMSMMIDDAVPIID
jgi:hypothetical protein